MESSIESQRWYQLGIPATLKKWSGIANYYATYNGQGHITEKVKINVWSGSAWKTKAHKNRTRISR